MTYIDLNLILLLWVSTALITRLSITYFQLILTMAKCKSDTQASKRWKVGLESEHLKITFGPLAMKSRGWEGVEAGNHSATQG
jgi:hypothetical protein